MNKFKEKQVYNLMPNKEIMLEISDNPLIFQIYNAARKEKLNNFLKVCDDAVDYIEQNILGFSIDIETDFSVTNEIMCLCQNISYRCFELFCNISGLNNNSMTRLECAVACEHLEWCSINPLINNPLQNKDIRDLAESMAKGYNDNINTVIFSILLGVFNELGEEYDGKQEDEDAISVWYYEDLSRRSLNSFVKMIVESIPNKKINFSENVILEIHNELISILRSDGSDVAVLTINDSGNLIFTVDGNILYPHIIGYLWDVMKENFENRYNGIEIDKNIDYFETVNIFMDDEWLKEALLEYKRNIPSDIEFLLSSEKEEQYELTQPILILGVKNGAVFKTPVGILFKDNLSENKVYVPMVYTVADNISDEQLFNNANIISDKKYFVKKGNLRAFATKCKHWCLSEIDISDYETYCPRNIIEILKSKVSEKVLTPEEILDKNYELKDLYKNVLKVF